MQLSRLWRWLWRVATVYILFSWQPIWASQTCAKLFADMSRQFILDRIAFYRSQQKLPKPIELHFFSEPRTSGASYRVDTMLGEGASQVFLTVDRTHVVKRYGFREKLPMYEILVTEFLLEQTKDVPRIVDFSGNVFHPDGFPIYVVKEYREGLSRHEREEVGLKDAKEWEARRREFRRVMSRFRGWVKSHDHGEVYLRKHARSVWTSSGDFKLDNWVFGPQGWILIDP